MKFRLYTSILLSACVCILLSPSLKAQEWVRFRGPNGTGMGKPLTLPDTLTEKDYRWKITLPGFGHSSPVLWGKKLFVTSANPDEGKRYLLCVNADTGAAIWKQTWNFTSYHRHEYNSFASSTPTVDSEQVYVLWQTPDSVVLYALDHKGNKIWERELGKLNLQHGGGSSPVVVEDTVLVSVEQEGAGNKGNLFGIDRKTGAIRWQSPREPSQGAPYATPLVNRTDEGKTEVIFASTAHGFTSLDPKTGSRNWEVAGLFPLRCVTSPIRVGDMVLASCGTLGSDKSAVALRLPSRANGKTAEVAYRIPKGVSYVPTPIVSEGRIYFWGDNGVVSCYEGATGKELWRERVGGDYFGSPVLCNGKIYALGTRGELTAISAGSTFKLLGKLETGEPTNSTPAIANGTLYVRTESHLIAIKGK